MENITIYLECGKTEILGVFGKGIHLLTHGYIENKKGKETQDIEDLILVIPETVYFKEWKKWIKGKKDYCERFNSYCGVMGYVIPDNPEFIGTQKIQKWNKLHEDYDLIEVPVYKASIFKNEPDFEHG